MRKADIPEAVDVSLAEVEDILVKTERCLLPKEQLVLRRLLEAYLLLLRCVREGRAAFARLRRLYGMTSSEKTKHVCGSQGGASLKHPLIFN